MCCEAGEGVCVVRGRVCCVAGEGVCVVWLVRVCVL